jgi:DNA-binding transcriptional MerR regulator
MRIMPAGAPITLKEVQARLGTPQHILIHLCERGVIEPDFTETAGRREFSRRNLFEFAVALALRKFELPVATAAFVIRLLRSFAQATAKLIPGFELPGSLLQAGPELTLRLYDGEYLVFRAGARGPRKELLLGVSIGDASKPGARPRLEKLDELPPKYDAQLEINLTQIARRIPE